ncbi:hypothetical protein SAMN02745857_02463 [Andreprevotia lacus DSM 23236]|jgi:hypothetical protein|uniref:Uncharacterized protein n=1 Tax=Andreprevotia lacus DSM 23236 TaxID=1121001 RepID=A0A1W1XR44_9NEIS|nr:hypothetical protein [Andreprevotia lacus]SMC26366.1 hypothetical protein SAMN02745857_02463 [Andreprevotia lacus DSM 23236]
MQIPAGMSNVVYVKTDRGQQEMQQRGSLSPLLRRLLIVVDGNRTVRMLSTMLAGQDVMALLQALEDQGFILNPSAIAGFKMLGQPSQPVASAPIVAPQPVAAVEEDEAELDPARIHDIKVLMRDSTTQFLGLMGSNLVAEIESVQNAARLKTVMARWNMALRESRTGAPYADQYLKAVKTLIRV